MRFPAAVAAVVCAASAVIAQDLIEWSPQRKLARQDFRGPVPAGAPSASLSWLQVEASWECRAGRLTFDVRALFDPSQSWWRPGSSSAEADRQLLEHEQIHFDIAEIAARKVRQHLRDAAESCGDPDRTDRVGGEIADIDRELQAEQQRYDRETRHGVDARQQARWKLWVARQLADW